MDIEAVVEKYRNRLPEEYPNVSGSGVGERKGKEVIVIFVTRKVPESDLQPQEIIPKELDGYETDVREIGEVAAY